MTQKHQTYLGVVVALAIVVLFFFIIGGALPQQDTALPSSQTTTMQNESFPMINIQETGELQVRDEVVGTGKEVVVGSRVTVEYVGALTNGTVFDTSRGRAPFSLTVGVGEVISGWDQGLLGMKEGGKRILIIPSDLAYGPNDYGPIPGGSTLVFQVELLSVE